MVSQFRTVTDKGTRILSVTGRQTQSRNKWVRILNLGSRQIAKGLSCSWLILWAGQGTRSKSISHNLDGSYVQGTIMVTSGRKLFGAKSLIWSLKKIFQRAGPRRLRIRRLPKSKYKRARLPSTSSRPWLTNTPSF